MGHSQAQKADNRERILAEAARQVRAGGLEAVNVAKLMQSVGLTHGGFYGHFASRSDLVAQSLERALVDGEATAQIANTSGRPRRFGEIVRAYLSRTHRDARSTGCAISALVSEVGRADEASRATMEAHIDSMVALVAEALGDEDEARAMAAVSAMVGCVAIARVIVDPKRSNAFLHTVREQLLAMDVSEPAWRIRG
jgi:TetR/AcrR family transcriptional repressor of nem operon